MDADKRRDLVQLLLDGGADVNAASEEGETPLHHALENEYHSYRTSRSPNSDNSGYVTPVVDILLENKADVNKVNEDGETPLYRAASGGFLGIVDKMLAEYGGDPNKGSPTKDR